MSRGLIAALSEDRVIGLDGRIPWHYPADLKRFKALTLGSTVIMGRKTWDSLPKRPLPGRRNIVITSQDLGGLSGADRYASLELALERAGGDLWFIGGAKIYQAALPYADFVDLTYIPETIGHPDAIRFPELDSATWEPGPRTPHPDDPRLSLQRFTRRPA